MNLFREVLALVLLLCVTACSPAATPTLPETPLPVATGTTAAPTQTAVLDPTAETPPSGGGGGTGASQETIDQALAEVSNTTGVPVGELQVTAVEVVDFPNSALGCPMPDQMYLDVITPGYRIEVQAGEDLFDVGSTLDGSTMVVCPRS
jgi:hypothetical protein